LFNRNERLYLTLENVHKNVNILENKQ
jgi:hypothetical protein